MTPALPASSPPPNWVESNHPLGWLIDRLLAVEPLRWLLFWQARRLIIRTAEGRGIAWRQRRELLQRAAEPLLVSTTNPAVAVPLLPGPFPRLRRGQPLLGRGLRGRAGHRLDGAAGVAQRAGACA